MKEEIATVHKKKHSKMINSFSPNEISMKHKKKSIAVLCNKVNTVTTKVVFLLNVPCNENLQYILDRVTIETVHYVSSYEFFCV
jgi:hypothetical protein